MRQTVSQEQVEERPRTGVEEMEMVLDKAQALEREKRRAAWFLAGATGLFALTLVWRGPPAWYIGLLRSMAEAAMVGGLADWFAVAALFRPVNLLGIIPIFPSHTAVIPRSKDRIASSLGEFVRDHFLKTETLVAIVRRNDPAGLVRDWFLEERNATRFGQQGAKMLTWAVGGLNEESIQAVVSKTVREALKGVDLSRTSGDLLGAMLSEGRHHQLLDEAIAKLTEMLRDPGTRATIASRIAETIQQEYPRAQLLLPTEAVGRFAADKMAVWIEDYLENVSRQPRHELRDAFDKKAKDLIVHLRGDPAFQAKGNQFKDFILNDEKFTGYIGSLWDSLRGMLERDLRDPDSEVHRKLVAAGSWIGRTLEQDEELRSSLNRQVEALVEQFGSSLGKFVSDHIEGTVKGWDAKAMSTLIEVNIGPDLQKIRINGTIIGGLLGGFLFAVAQVASGHG